MLSGWSGSVSIDENGTRNPVIQVTTVDRHDRPSTYLIVAVAGDTAVRPYTQAKTQTHVHAQTYKDTHRHTRAIDKNIRTLNC